MKQNPDYKLFLCMATVGIVWGTTFLGIRIAVETIPPWFVTSIRQGLAALMLMSILIYKKELAWIGWENFRHQFIPAVLMIVVTNGFTTVAEQTLPSGLTSIISALMPVLVFIGSVFYGLQKFGLKGLAGVVICFSGIIFIFKDGLGSLLDSNYKIGIMFIVLANIGWAVGTIYMKIHNYRSHNIVLNLFYQFTIATLVQLVLAFIFSSDTDVSTWSLRSLSATLYLAIFGSIFGFLCYHYALKRVSTVQVSILSYLNTIIAIFLGWLLLNEIITTDFIIATALIILGVFILNYKKNAKKIV